MKKCTKCKEEKKLTEFSKSKTKKDGLGYRCKSCIKKYYQANKERVKEICKEYYQANKERIKESSKKYYQANKENIKENNKEYQKANKERINHHKKEYRRERRKTDPLFKMRCNLRKRTWAAFKSKYWQKNNTTKDLLGCTFEEAKQHIEKQFTKGMNWNNYGKWHIDHIIPLASAKNEQEICNLCHYTNLQPLWAEDNIKKGNKII